MKKFRTVITLLLAMPFAAFSASLQPDAVAGAGPAGIVLENAGNSTECCYVFILGRWFCVAC